MAIVSASAFWGSAYAPINDNASSRKRVAQLLNKPMLAKDRELLLTLLGAVAGSAALARKTRIAHSLTELGGVRLMETETFVDRVTVAGDETDLAANILGYDSTTNAYPVDAATRA